MTQDAVLRRLSAILAADVAGYSRLIAADEVGTLSRFRKIRMEILDPAIARFGGALMGSAGDSLLVEFTNALAAVECAAACQQGLAAANADEPEDRRILFRMGINLGDVIAADNTIHGDGVNIAARIEKLAEPGSLCIARNVYEQIQGKVDLSFTDLGEHNVKNIAQPIRVYRVGVYGRLPVTAKTGVTARQPVDADKISIAVLPFDNMSGDPEQGYFSDGITEDIITELSRFRELLVIARNSSFQFRGKSADIREVGQKLGVRFVVEGSVRKAGSRVRVTAQLVDTVSAAHIWAERYDRDLTDVFEIQDEITRTIVTRVANQARAAGTIHSRTRPTESLSAYDCYLQAREMFVSDVTAPQAEPLLLRSIEIDPNFANAHALLSILYTIKYMHDGQARHLDDALASGHRALELDPEESKANHALGFALTHLRRFDEAGHYLERAIALNPNEIFPRGDYANWMNCTGRTEEALREIDEAQRRDPFGQDWFWDVRARIEADSGRFDDALHSYRRMKTISPWGHSYRAICYIELGQLAEAKRCLELAKIAMPSMTPKKLFETRHYDNPARLKQLLDALRRIEPAELLE